MGKTKERRTEKNLAGSLNWMHNDISQLILFVLFSLDAREGILSRGMNNFWFRKFGQKCDLTLYHFGQNLIESENQEYLELWLATTCVFLVRFVCGIPYLTGIKTEYRLHIQKIFHDFKDLGKKNMFQKMWCDSGFRLVFKTCQFFWVNVSTCVLVWCHASS